ncbi:MAG: HEAT repeat domain-containing protein, partial [Planctomycetota bacterium]|nr:HEAT repeat domain-containing protein [Planctomycetota bacterium]
MSAARHRRQVVRLAGVAVIVVLVVLVSAWKEVVARYHLVRLRADGGYLEEIVDAPPGSAGRRGLRLFVRSEEGKQTVLEALVSGLCDRPQVQEQVRSSSRTVAFLSSRLVVRSTYVDDILRNPLLESAAIVVLDSGDTPRMNVRYHVHGSRSVQGMERVRSRADVLTLFELLGEFDDRRERRVVAFPSLRFSVATPETARRDHGLHFGATDDDARNLALVVTSGPEAIPRLLDEFRSGRAASASGALASFGLDGRTLLEVVLGRFEYERLEWWHRAGNAARQAVVKALEAAAADRAFRMKVILAVSEFDDGLIPHARQLLRDPDDLLRAETLYLLGFSGQGARGAIPSLLELIRREKTRYVRRAAVRSLAMMVSPADETIVGSVLDLLGDADAVVRARAAIVLSSIGSEEPRVVEALARSLTDPVADVRFRASQALGALGPAAASAVPALRVAVADEHGL